MKRVRRTVDRLMLSMLIVVLQALFLGGWPTLSQFRQLRGCPILALSARVGNESFDDGTASTFEIA
jgi:hypothetical protein